MSWSRYKFEPRMAINPPTGEAKKKCNACPRLFTPTVKRRMLCAVCFSGSTRKGSALAGWELEW